MSKILIVGNSGVGIASQLAKSTLTHKIEVVEPVKSEVFEITNTHKDLPELYIDDILYSGKSARNIRRANQRKNNKFKNRRW